MITFDPDKYDAVGIALEMGMSNNAQILAIGMVSRSSGEFIPVPSGERSKAFPTRGNVFAYDFFKHHPMWKNECVLIGAKPNNNQSIVNGEDFVWDWQEEENIYAPRVKKLKTPIGEDGGKNYDILTKEGITAKEDKTYFICGGSIYRFEPRARLLPYWKLSAVESSLCTYNGISYLIHDITKTESGKVDLTSDDQLIEWYKKNVLRKEWGAIYEAKDFKIVDDLVTAELKTLKIPSNVYESRLSRILTLSSNITLTFEELEDLATTPWFSDTILSTLDRFSDLYIEKIRENHAEELDALKARGKKEIKDLKEQIALEKDIIKLEVDDKRKELETINSRIEKEEKERRTEVDRLQASITELEIIIDSKKREIERLESRKESIISDYAIIKEVLGTGCSPATNASSIVKECPIEVINDEGERAFPVIGPYRKNLESYLMSAKASKVPVDEIVTKMATNDVVLFPDDAVLLATMKATRKCSYVVEYVGVSWKSFDDLWGNGLGSIVRHAINYSEEVHFLVLRNINMSFIPSYLQPVLDMQSGLMKCFPGTDLEFPENLRILCTRTTEAIIPVSETSIKGIGCIAPSEENYSGYVAPIDGYLTAEVFGDLPVSDPYCDQNPFETYIDEL